MSKGLAGVRADQKLSYRKIEARATCARECLRLSPSERLNALDLFENVDELEIELRDGRLVPLLSGVKALEDSEGYARYDRSKHVVEILASEQTYTWLEQSHPRASYFVAHELGHCILHTDQLVRLAQMPTHQQAAYHRGGADHQPCQDTEWQANAFASALLMPMRGIQSLETKFGFVTPSLIAMNFAVSKEAAQYRLELYRARGDDLLI
jgi:IrrE N-terminal-like domain